MKVKKNWFNDWSSDKIQTYWSKDKNQAHDHSGHSMKIHHLVKIKASGLSCQENQDIWLVKQIKTPNWLHEANQSSYWLHQKDEAAPRPFSVFVTSVCEDFLLESDQNHVKSLPNKLQSFTQWWQYGVQVLEAAQWKWAFISKRYLSPPKIALPYRSSIGWREDIFFYKKNLVWKSSVVDWPQKWSWCVYCLT